MSPLVCSAAAVMNDHTKRACPAAGTHGWTWSAAMTPEKPLLPRRPAEVEQLGRAELLEHGA
jgi:hypothetical protein